jgi:hypothetical protein
VQIFSAAQMEFQELQVRLRFLTLFAGKAGPSTLALAAGWKRTLALAVDLLFFAFRAQADDVVHETLCSPSIRVPEIIFFIQVIFSKKPKLKGRSEASC